MGGTSIQLQEQYETVIVCPSCKAREDKAKEEKREKFQERRAKFSKATDAMKERKRKEIVDKLIKDKKESGIRRKPHELCVGARVRFTKHSHNHQWVLSGRKTTGTVSAITVKKVWRCGFMEET